VPLPGYSIFLETIKVNTVPVPEPRTIQVQYACSRAIAPRIDWHGNEIDNQLGRECVPAQCALDVYRVPVLFLANTIKQESGLELGGVLL